MNQLSLEITTGGKVRQPLIVSCGMGVDSIAVLIGLWKRGIKPDLIIFADVGAEREKTYEYIAILNAWLREVWGMEVVIVRYQAKNFKHWPPYHTIEENILTNASLPAIAYGGHTCSAKWKIAPINAYVSEWKPAIECWRDGGKVRKAIGFEFSPHELRRSKRCGTFAIQDDEAEKYDFWFPLQEWKWNRAQCVAEIKSVGLPEPCKSSCYFCTAMKPHEVDGLSTTQLKNIVILEARANPRHIAYAEKRAAELGQEFDGKPLTEGLWRKRVKGMRGATARPGSMTEYIRERGLLPSSEVDRLKAATPGQPFTQADFLRLGFTNWQDWLKAIRQ